MGMLYRRRHREVTTRQSHNCYWIKERTSKHKVEIMGMPYRWRRRKVTRRWCKGADVHAKGGKYGNELQAASAEGCEAIVELLLDRGADVYAKGGKYANALLAASSEVKTLWFSCCWAD